jgi:2-oxoglutarate dehydrogenase complex dehydrogenase (E1) component-like enzyme
VLLHAGKIHWDLKAELDKKPNPQIALVRLEQLYPAPIDELNAVIDSYPNAELVWVQDEPENQGAWPFIALEDERDLRVRLLVQLGLEVPVDLAGVQQHAGHGALVDYPNAELVWVQDEPENQGAWPFIALEVVKHLHGRTIRRVSRAAAASTATGSPRVHAREQAEITPAPRSGSCR